MDFDFTCQGNAMLKPLEHTHSGGARSFTCLRLVQTSLQLRCSQAGMRLEQTFMLF